MDLHRLQAEILDEMVPEARVNANDAAAIARHTDLLLGMEDELVEGFYDTLFAHRPTAAVFDLDERLAREETLRRWWRRTVTGPLDEGYWTWMGVVGVVHIRRGVRNPMMLSMMAFVEQFVRTRTASLPAEEAGALGEAFAHVTATTAAVISESYTQAYVSALQALGGLNPKLLANMLSIEIRAVEDAARTSLG